MNHQPRSSAEERAAESRRILASVNDEMQVTGLGNRIAGHFIARDADQSDQVEVLGRRIGRLLSLILCLGLIAWLAIFILNNAA